VRLAKSAEAIGEDPLEGRARLGLVVIVPIPVVPAPLSVAWSAVGAKTSDLDGRSIAALKMLSCAREQTPAVRERAETASAGDHQQDG
jgi:hypothetical protein